MFKNVEKKCRNMIEWLRSMIADCEVFFLGGNDVLPPPLSAEEEFLTLSKLESDPQNAKKVLIERNLRLVVYIAKKFENTNSGIEDLISIGTIGLIKAINTFKTEKNIKLATYASKCIENEILMFLRKNNKTKSEVSLDEPLNVDWEGNELLLSDIIGTENDVVNRELEEEDERSLLREAVTRLSERERQIIELRFGFFGRNEMTQKEVADLLGISQSYISRLEKRIFSRLKKDLDRVG